MDSFVIIASGDELVQGKRINTNSHYISDILTQKFITTAYHLVCQDNYSHMKQMISRIIKENNIIITGGLGPTDDDITRDVVADVMNKPLQYQAEVAESVVEYLNGKGIKSSDRHHKQFYFPENSILFENCFGTAWGFAIENDGKWIYALPGPPRECQPIFTNCISHIETHIKPSFEHRLHWQLHAPEEKIVSLIDDIVSKYNLEIHTCTHSGYCDVYLHLQLESWEKKLAHELADEITAKWRAGSLNFKTLHKFWDHHE